MAAQGEVGRLGCDGHEATVPDYGVGGLYSTNADILITPRTRNTLPLPLQLCWQYMVSAAGAGRGLDRGGGGGVCVGFIPLRVWG